MRRKTRVKEKRVVLSGCRQSHPDRYLASSQLQQFIKYNLETL